jgi:TraX protein
MFFKRTDNLTNNLTSYDFLKCMTLIFMICDHIGAFLYPEQTWLRVIGRMGFPAWFFLAGFSKGREISQTLWIGAALVIFGNFTFGQYMFPANALVSYICIRLFIAHFYKKIFSSWEFLLYATIICLLLSLPTNYLFEYGTLVFLLALFGYAVRNKDDLKINKEVYFIFSVVVMLSVIVLQIFTFGFTEAQSIVCFIEMSLIGIILYRFKSEEYPRLTEKLPSYVTKVVQWGGRYTLEIYVIHLLLIKAYLFYAHYGHYNWFSPTYFMNIPVAVN